MEWVCSAGGLYRICQSEMHSLDMGLASESQCRARLRFCGFFFAILGRSRGFERSEKAYGHRGYFVDGGQEHGFIGLGGLVESGDLADELNGGSADFFVGNRGIEVEESFNIAAHNPVLVGQNTILRKRYSIILTEEQSRVTRLKERFSDWNLSRTIML